MENLYRYFDRDISWLSFNYRVLLEADNDSLPLYERINFIAIYSSNLEEFYKVRVAEHKAVASGGKSDGMSVDEARRLIHEIKERVNAQLDDRVRIYEQKILPALRANHIIFYQGRQEVEPFHKEFISRFFREELFPYIQPVKVEQGKVRMFLRDKRFYLAVRLRSRDTGERAFYILKIPHSKVPRFVVLPPKDGNYYLMFLEDIIKMNLHEIFTGYEEECSYCCKISRDADVFVDDVPPENMVEQLKEKVKKRKIGAICRFVYDRKMPDDFLDFLVEAFGINREELVPGDKHLNLEDLSSLPNPSPVNLSLSKPAPMRLPGLDGKHFMYRRIAQRDLLLYYPYYSFDHFIRFLYEAVHDSQCREIMITQYRVAEHSEVIGALIAAAQNGKRVTVFVELKARFDEENNLATAELMRKAGIHIIFSIPGLKVHAKVALVLRADRNGKPLRSYAYVSTGNFNEKTARIYSDIALFTCNPAIVEDMRTLFGVLKREVETPVFKRLLVARFNLLPELRRMIHHEIQLARSGKEGRIILKMNALQDEAMIDELYRASEAGVQIDLIVRGICCLIPGESFSRNIRVTRIVDSFLEHARVWYFGNGGNPKLFLGSPDWMKRNLYRRIEAVTPVTDKRLKQELTDMLELQLRADWNACWVDNQLNNVFKRPGHEGSIRAQYEFYRYLQERYMKPGVENGDSTVPVV
jgi:polyphosphate kinase